MEQGLMTSSALASNLYGDSATRSYSVYLPLSYDISAKRYPVVYVLHSWYYDENSMIASNKPTLDAMILQRNIGEMIAVFVNATNTLYGSWYLSSPVLGDYETYIVRDLVGLIDSRYRTLPARESRGVTGLSMGGAGTMHLALKYPEIFSVAVAVAGSYNSRSSTRDARARQLASYHPTNLSQFRAILPIDWHLCALQAHLAGLLPNPQRPYLYTDYPYEWVDGQAVLSQSADQRCRDGDVQNGDLVRYRLQPVHLNGVQIVHGSADPDVPVADAREFTNALSQAGVEFEYREHAGGHVYRADLAWPFLSSHLQGAEAYDRPVITAQPTNQSARIGSTVTFAVTAYSPLPVTYQWQWNAANMLDATNATLTRTNVQLVDEGVYTVVVTDITGAVVSAPAVLTVLIDPVIVLQPCSVSVPQGGSVTLSVAVTNTATLPIGYRWRRGSTTVAHVVAHEYVNFLSLTNCQVTTNYEVIVTNLARMSVLRSSNAVVTVLPDTDADGLPDPWEIACGISQATVHHGAADDDGDGLSNLQEYTAGTDPTNALSYVKVDTLALADGGRAAVLQFLAVSNQTYTVQYREAVEIGAWSCLADVVAVPTNRLVTIRDPEAVGTGQARRFYRLVTPRAR